MSIKPTKSAKSPSSISLLPYPPPSTSIYSMERFIAGTDSVPHHHPSLAHPHSTSTQQDTPAQSDVSPLLLPSIAFPVIISSFSSRLHPYRSVLRQLPCIQSYFTKNLPNGIDHENTHTLSAGDDDTRQNTSSGQKYLYPTLIDVEDATDPTEIIAAKRSRMKACLEELTDAMKG